MHVFDERRWRNAFAYTRNSVVSKLECLAICRGSLNPGGSGCYRCVLSREIRGKCETSAYLEDGGERQGEPREVPLSLDPFSFL